jgi:hypothetical protein
VDLKIGVLHAYPNSELQFENYNTEVANNDNKKRMEKKVRMGGDLKKIETNPYQDDGLLTFTMDNKTTISVKTPNTFMNGRASCKSQVTR